MSYEPPRVCSVCADVIWHPAGFYVLYRGKGEVVPLCEPCVDDKWLAQEEYQAAGGSQRILYLLAAMRSPKWQDMAERYARIGRAASSTIPSMVGLLGAFHSAAKAAAAQEQAMVRLAEVAQKSEVKKARKKARQGRKPWLPFQPWDSRRR